MPNTQVQNFALNASNEKFHAIWKLTRAMKAAGWRYKASGDGQSTTIAAGSNGQSLPQATINVASTTNFAASGTILVTTAAGIQTVTYTGTGGTTFTGCSGGTGAMSTGGLVQTLKDTTGNPSNDKWGGGVQVGAQTATGAFTIGAATTTSYGGRSTITGLTGFTTSSPGHFLVITGATNGANNGTWLITKYVSATSVVIENPAAVSETTGGGATWTEKDALLDTYPTTISASSGIGAWWCAQGPSTMRIPIGTATGTGTFVRGENVVQATSGATGEFMGMVTDTGGLGYIVVAPRLSGTGAGPRGWSASATITGDKSGATVSPTGTVLEYLREIVFWKGSTTTGHMYYQVIESVTEASTTTTTGRFSTLAALATATSIICPGGATGGNPSNNGFPTTGTLCAGGTGGSGAGATSAVDLFVHSTSVTTGLATILCANAIEDDNSSPDASFTVVCGIPATSANVFQGWAFMRLDDTEDGEVDPYVFCMSTTGSFYTRVRTANTGQSGTADNMTAVSIYCDASRSAFIGWRRRGMPSADAYQEFQGSILGGAAAGTSVIYTTAASPDRVACAFVNVAVREPIWVYSSQVSQKQRKGTLRWWYVVQGGNGTDTYDGKRWIQLSSSASGPIVVGPADQSTSPLNG